ncbi:FkbM family methyltransferase [Pseudomonadota bacterium]
MIEKILRSLHRYFRRLLGTELILQNQRALKRELDYQHNQLGVLRQLLLKANSLSEYSLMDLSHVKDTPMYKLCAETVSLLSPMDVEGGTYIRMGKNFDGGYIMLDCFHRQNVDAAYSFGISNDVSWDEAVADRGIEVFMFDHTIAQLPKLHPNFHYFKTGLTGHQKEPNLKTLSKLLTENGHEKCRNLILKMDIEGAEWDVFDETPSVVIQQFSQIVVELHGLVPEREANDSSLILKVLKKINETHQSVHVHANTGGSSLWTGDLVLPNLIEVTFIRRRDFEGKLVKNKRRFPTEIDQPTLAGSPDLDLGTFSID